MKVKMMIVLVAALSIAPSVMHGQFDFKLADRTIQVHSFASQGFASTNDNNYLTMKTTDGSFAMTDGGVNASVALTEKLRVGAQVYVRNFGRMGKLASASGLGLCRLPVQRLVSASAAAR